METSRRSGLVGGLILILVGGAFLAAQFVPGLREWFRAADSWPLIVIGVGGLMLVLAVALSTPPLAVPGCIVGGIGCLLFYQNATGNWESWAYAWTLIPGFVGFGVMLAALMQGQSRKGITAGLWLMLISLLGFFVFGSFMGLGRFSPYWPVLLVLGGLLILGQTLFGRKS
jgi:hypothetical protein